MELTVGNVVKQSIAKGMKNLVPLSVNALLWIVTLWIPYFNIGTTIGLFVGIMTKIAKDEPLSFTEIFDKKYRKNIGEFILTTAFCSMGISVGALFFFIPAIVISMAWSLAIPLVIDKEYNPSEALTISNNVTYGHKWTMFWSYFILSFVLFAVFGVLSSILGMILGLLGGLIMIVGFAAVISIQISAQSVIYNTLSGNLNPQIENTEVLNS